MRSLLMTMALLTLPATGNAAADPATFAERVAAGRSAANPEPVRKYLEGQLHPVTKPFSAEAVRVCTNHPCANRDPFTVVADVARDGTPSRIDYEPKTDASECFANALAKLRLPAPPPEAGGTLAIILEVRPAPGP